MTDHDVQLVRIFIERFSSGNVEAAIKHLYDRAAIDEPGDISYSGRHVGSRGLPLPPFVGEVSVTDNSRSGSP